MPHLVAAPSAGAPVQSSRARSWARMRALSQTSAKAITSAFVVSGPSDTRSPDDAATSSNPMARNTPLALTLPEEQADPAETAKPARSICITCVSPRQPDVTMKLVLGNRTTSFPTKIVEDARSSSVISRIFLSSATRSQTPFSRSCVAASAAAPNPAIPIRFSVPARRPISCPPPRIWADGSSPRRKISAPIPFGPPILWAETNAIPIPDQSKAKGSLPKACVQSLTASPAGRS